MTKKLVSYRFDEKSLALIQELKDSLGLDNNSAVIRKAIALLKIAAEESDARGVLVVKTKSGIMKEIVLC